MVVVAAVVAVDKSGGQQWQWRTRDGSGRTGDAAEEIDSNGQHSAQRAHPSPPHHLGSAQTKHCILGQKLWCL